jgi:hypothetical protein
MKNHWLVTTRGGLLVAGIIPLVALVLSLSAVRGMAGGSSAHAQPAPIEPAQSGAAQIEGTYRGPVKLEWTLGGVYSDTLATPTPQPAGTPAPPDLGSIDLALQLSQAGNVVSGYVALDRTLVFTVEHTIMATPVGPAPLPGTPTPRPTPLAIGPYVHGVFDGTTLTLTSERVSMIVAGRPIMRQFSLTGAIAQGDAARLTGQYRETLWGYAREPITVLGTFTLQRAGVGTSVPATPNTAYLPLIQR